MGPQNGIVGDNDLNPEVSPDPVVTEGEKEIKRAASFIKTPEFKELKAYLETRMDFYRQYLPDGTAVANAKMSYEEKGRHWDSATVIIQEFKAVINAFESAAERAKDVTG